MRKIVIAVDGPAGAGKSTVAKIIANKLGINYIDTGAMYRAITYKALEKGIDINDNDRLINLCKSTEIDFQDENIYLDGKIVNEEIRQLQVSSNVSRVAQIKEVREIMVYLQRKMADRYSVIMDGRDIGSYVFPNADYKFFLTASVQERANRRYMELKNKGYDVTIEDIIKDIETRDKIDSEREFAPLVKAKDAIEVNTSNKSIDEVVHEILNCIKMG
ncbi:cytidylate kinase [Alkalithermobacter thermoalcaliphilus JW-YL-7 = DSM 7308]|uniref:Cytidylate kinase n=1 Tax=Alkalithermobacter thermoalcaliphilus JW-YL-7 = DSM 7308 TaxID=1121328 RepID=A0A150FQI7_CLOPD|nr:Cytidylate kinase [[Clostridium] paradoxum JW-YL-7 = DSM 7308]SHK79071.1 cytidylate kinase [[Clostridium] paradoxum JW-YL-7 = DSM 7308]